MSLDCSAINEMAAEAAHAKAMWCTGDPASAAPPRHVAEPQRSPVSEARLYTMRFVRSIDYQRLFTRQRLSIIVVAMLAFVLGLALRGGPSPVVGSAAAAAPAAPAKQIPTLVVTPIEEAPPTVAAQGADTEVSAPAVEAKRERQPAKKAKRKKAKKRPRGMSSADEEW